MYVRNISLSRTSYSIFISGGLYCRIYAFYVHYPEEGNNNTLTNECSSLVGLFAPHHNGKQMLAPPVNLFIIYITRE